MTIHKQNKNNDIYITELVRNTSEQMMTDMNNEKVSESYISIRVVMLRYLNAIIFSKIGTFCLIQRVLNANSNFLRVSSTEIRSMAGK